MINVAITFYYLLYFTKELCTIVNKNKTYMNHRNSIFEQMYMVGNKEAFVIESEKHSI